MKYKNSFFFAKYKKIKINKEIVFGERENGSFGEKKKQKTTKPGAANSTQVHF